MSGWVALLIENNQELLCNLFYIDPLVMVIESPHCSQWKLNTAYTQRRQNNGITCSKI